MLAKRRLEKEAGTYVPQDDAIDWMEDSAPKKYDPLDVQISLSAAAIINTTQLLGTVLSHIAANPYIHEPLRQEIRQNLQETGMTKATLQNLKLMDSCIRESARVNPLSLGKPYLFPPTALRFL